MLSLLVAIVDVKSISKTDYNRCFIDTYLKLTKLIKPRTGSSEHPPYMYAQSIMGNFAFHEKGL